VAVRESGRRLVDVLLQWLRERLSDDVPMARARALVVSGGVRVDGEVVRAAGRLLRRGEHVEAILDPEQLRARAHRVDRPFELTAARILYQDGFVLAVDKPPGLPTHATADPSRPSLVSHVERFVRAAVVPRNAARTPRARAESGADKGTRSEQAVLSVHQRLDRDTSGVVIFGLDPRANAGLTRAFADHAADKTYLAITVRPRELRGRTVRISAPLAPGTAGRAAVVVGGPTARPAETDVVVREVLDEVLVVEARPLSGRRHQVRVHLAHAGLPIVGDPTYGRPDARAPRLMLHAWRLALAHPVTGEPLRLEAPIPADFSAVVEAFRRR
jgi:23S rRNA pseudouridine1911/1915/1917 synthase